MGQCLPVVVVGATVDEEDEVQSSHGFPALEELVAGPTPRDVVVVAVVGAAELVVG